MAADPHIRRKGFSMKYWLTTEVKFLKRYYGKLLVSEIAKQLNRTETAVNLKANKLGLSSDMPKHIGRDSSELIQLVETGHTPRTIAKLWGVTPKSVYNTYRDRADLGQYYFELLLKNRMERNDTSRQKKTKAHDQRG